MNITCIVFGIMFTVAGALFASGKLHPHMSMWKNMPEEEKDKINILPLCRNVGEVILLSGIIFLLKGFLATFNDHWFTCAMVAWLIVAGLDVCFICKSKRFRNQ